MPDIYPAKIYSYDADSRTCRIEMEGLTTGADSFPVAEINYPIGDKSHDTELEILKDDLIWVSFINGDPRYPLIMGSRAKDKGSLMGLRHYHHKNFRVDTDETLSLHVGDSVSIEMDSGKIVLTVGSNTFTMTDGSIVSPKDATFVDTSVDKHVHGGISPGGSKTAIPD